MHHSLRRVRVGDEEQVNRPVDLDAVRDLDDGAVVHERGVERSERVDVVARDLADAIDDFRCRRPAPTRDRGACTPARQFAAVRQLSAKSARSRTPSCTSRDAPNLNGSRLFALNVAARRVEQREFLIGDRRGARVMPVLVLRRRKPERRKSFEGGAPHGLHPGGVAASDVNVIERARRTIQRRCRSSGGAVTRSPRRGTRPTGLPDVTQS